MEDKFSTVVHRPGELVHHITRTTLLSFPRDCRDLVLEMLLLNRSQIWNDDTIDANVQPIPLHIPWVGNSGVSTSPYTISMDRIHIGNVAVLRVCRQLCSEGRCIMYGRNSFVSYNFPQFKYRLHTVIGKQNMKLMQRVTIGMPMKHKRDPTLYLGGFLEFFKEKLPNLTELNLTTQFSRFDDPLNRQSLNTRFGEEYRAMLNTSAWITCRHPQLKKAIWLVQSGGIIPEPWVPWASLLDEMSEHSDDDSDEHDSELNQLVDGQNDDDGTANVGPAPVDHEHNTGTEATNSTDGGNFNRGHIDDVYMCRLTVKFLALDRRFKIREQERVDLIPSLRKVVAKVCSNQPYILHRHEQVIECAQDIILDSRAIRRVDWTDLHGADPRNFALGEDAVSSEPPLPLVSRSRDHGGMVYANYAAVSDHLRDCFKYLSMKDKNRLTGERIAKETTS